MLFVSIILIKRNKRNRVINDYFQFIFQLTNLSIKNQNKTGYVIDQFFYQQFKGLISYFIGRKIEVLVKN